MPLPRFESAAPRPNPFRPGAFHQDGGRPNLAPRSPGLPRPPDLTNTREPRRGR